MLLVSIFLSLFLNAFRKLDAEQRVDTTGYIGLFRVSRSHRFEAESCLLPMIRILAIAVL